MQLTSDTCPRCGHRAIIRSSNHGFVCSEGHSWGEGEKEPARVAEPSPGSASALAVLVVCGWIFSYCPDPALAATLATCLTAGWWVLGRPR